MRHWSAICHSDDYAEELWPGTMIHDGNAVEGVEGDVKALCKTR
jgi:hypothetical protein